MNLFESLQQLKESENPIVSEFKEFLASKNAQYIYNELGETKDGMQIVIYDGDWKHEHLYMKNLINEFFENKGMNIEIRSEEIGKSEQDTYSAKYNVIFNAKPKAYTANVKQLKFTTEDVDTSNWKQRFKGMDIYISDKYPDYQIKKSYTSAKQEVWQVLNFKTGREVFASGTFEGAVDYIENGKTPRKPKALDNLGESNVSGWKYIDKTTTHDDIFGDINEGNYHVRHYEGDMTGYIYPPSETEKNYRAKLSSDNKTDSLGYQVFNNFSSAKNWIDKLAAKLCPVSAEQIKQQLEEIDTHKYLKIDIDTSPNLNNTKVMITGTLISGDEITLYDSSYLKTQRDIDFIKKQYAKAIKEIEHMREIGYAGVKDESTKVEESNHNEILDRDYATGEKIYNELKDYLNSLDQIAMDGEDCNWEPSEFNAKNLNADGEIYLECGAYILIYPYVNEWADKTFTVQVIGSSDLNSQLKNGIENIFNKFKSDKWNIVFED